jgi:hypothetical protein
MTPAIQPYEAIFTIKRDGRSRETRKAVIAWDDDGNALVADRERGALQAAKSYGNFVRLDEARGRAVGVIPGGGWRAVFQHENGTETVSVLAWAFDADRYGTPLYADEEGNVTDLQEISNLVRLVPPEEEAR